MKPNSSTQMVIATCSSHYIIILYYGLILHASVLPTKFQMTHLTHQAFLYKHTHTHVPAHVHC